MKVHVKSFLAKRGIRPPEEDTLEQNRINLSDEGYTVKDPTRNRKEKFAAYGQFAKDKNPHKFFAPPGYEDFAIQKQQDQADAVQRAQDERDAHELEKKEAAEKKKEKKKRGLFGRKKSSKKEAQMEEEAAAAAAAKAAQPTYDPYAVVSGPPETAVDPYRSRNSASLDMYNNTMRDSAPRATSMDPYSTPSGQRSGSNDPYGSSSSSRAQSADPYSGSQSRDPYGGSQSKDPYGGSQSNDPYGGSQNKDPYGSSQNSDPYGGSSQTKDSYGSSQNKDPYGSSYNSDPYGSSSNLNSIPSQVQPSSNSRSNGYSNSSNSDPYSSYTSNTTPGYNNNKSPVKAPANTYNRSAQGAPADPTDDLNYSGASSDAASAYKEDRSPVRSRNAARTSSGPMATSTRGAPQQRPSELNSYNTYTVPSPPMPQSSMGGGASGGSKNPYASLRNDNYSSVSGSKPGNPYGAPDSGMGYGSKRTANPYSAARAPTTQRSMRRPETAQSMDLNRTATNDLNRTVTTTTDLNATPSIMGGVVGSSAASNAYGGGGLDLNATPSLYGGPSAALTEDLNADDGQRAQQQMQQLDLNATEDDQRTQYGADDSFTFENQQMQQQQSTGYGDDLNNEIDTDRGYKTFEEIQREEEQRQQQEEDNAVDELKQQIKFTKQSSVASTRNTLKMAQEAEMSGMNTLGLLGHQSEKLNNVERNLDLMNVQNSIADEKVTELQKLNRSLWAVHVSNPFNSKRRKQEREDKIKNQKIEEKAIMDQTNQGIIESTNRIENAMNENTHNISDVRDRYERKDILNRAQKYQFENDSDDNEMEVEIDRNLDKIQQVSGRLKKLALAAGSEIDSQQERIKHIEDNTDDLDIKIHVNTTKLSTIK